MKLRKTTLGVGRLALCCILAAVSEHAMATVAYTYEDGGKTFVATTGAAGDAISSEAISVLDANEITNFVVRGGNALLVDKPSMYTGDVRLEAGMHVTSQNALGVGPGKIYVSPKKKMTMNGGVVAKAVHFDSGTADWNSDTGISAWQGDSEYKSLVTFSERNFVINPYANSFLAFSGGLQGPGYLYLREGAGGTLVFTNVAANLPRVISVWNGTKPDSGPPYAIYLVFAVAGNSLAGIGNTNVQGNRFTYCKLSTTVDWAFDNTSQAMNFGAGSLWDLCGTSQRVGHFNANSLNCNSVAAEMSVVTNSYDSAAKLYVNQNANATPAIVFGGRLSVDFGGSRTTTIDHAMTAEGELSVSGGTLAFTGDGSWRNATRVSVADRASITAVNGATFGEGVELALSGDGSISLPAGVVQKVALLSVDGSYQPHGTYEAGSGEIEVAYSGRKDVVDGALTLADGESLTLDAYVMCDSFDKIVLGDGASLAIDDASFLSSNIVYTITLGRNATVALPDGQGIVASSVMVGGATLPAGRYESAGWLLGGAVFVPQGAITGTDVAWIGEGVDTLMTTEGNWRGAADLANGTTRAVFAEGGTAATVTGSVFLNGLSFNKSGAFTVDSSAGAQLRLASGGITTAGSGTYTISAPLVVDGDQTWDIGKAATISGGIHSDPLATYTLRKTGSAEMTVSGPGDFAGDVLIESSAIVASGADPLGTAGKISLVGDGRLTLAGATISKPIMVNAGTRNYGNKSGFSVWGDHSPSEVKSKVTLAGTESSFNVYIYSNGSNRGKVTFSGGIVGASDYPHLYLNGGGATGTGYSTVVFTNRPFVFGSNRYLSLHSQSINANGISYEMIISVPGNACMAFGHPSYRAEHAKLYTTVDGAFANETMSLYCGNDFTWDLCGTAQNIGTINSVHTSGNPPTVTNSSETVASLAVRQADTAECRVVFAGNLDVAFNIGTGKTLTVSDAMPATGSLTVTGGTLALSADGTWNDASAVTVGAGGKVTVANSRAFGRKTSLSLASSASLEVASGVVVRVGSLSVGGVPYAPGTTHQFGDGMVTVGGGGVMLIFR